jgi:hypothetical protein
MDVPTDTLSPFVPAWGAPDDWNDAYEKAENYLRACRINSRLHRARLIHRILERVAARGPVPDGDALSTAAIRETQAMMEEWFGRLLPPAAGGLPPAEGRVGLLLCDGPERWPYAFLSTADLPADFVREMRASMLVAAPHLEVSNMVPRPIDYGWLPEFAGDTIEHLDRNPMLKALVAWAFFLLLLAFLFYITRR